MNIERQESILYIDFLLNSLVHFKECIKPYMEDKDKASYQFNVLYNNVKQTINNIDNITSFDRLDKFNDLKDIINKNK